MARIYSTPSAEQTARAWFHDVTLAADLNSKNLRGHIPYSCRNRTLKKCASEVCDELVNRDFTNVDQQINLLTNLRFNTSFDGSGNNKRLKPEAIAKALVYVAEQMHLYWDDTVRTPYEIDEFKKTYLGSVVYKYGRYISAIPDKGNSGSSNRVSTRTPGQPPKNNYKQSGPQSGNVRDLLDLSGNPGTPGQKVKAGTSFIYKIIGDNPQSRNIPKVFIKPLSATGATGTTNKIFISSGNGYTDCTCYFDDPNDAQAFLDKIISAGRVPANISNMRVVKNKAEANGYFIVGTEFGPCAVSAKTLNEALEESIEESNKILGWEKATENYSNEELDELHTWMRRG
jgi:hypothetical protein